MARLNEPPVSTDSLETLRKKLLRQNRDLAKSNNVRALRIRELENECAFMLSENLQLRGRILELEKEAEDNDARRIADHALAIKSKLESQLYEWGTLIAGLGLEPPMKRHSPRIKKSVKPRLSFSSTRPSPSQRRLRDIAKDIEELGYISENKSYPRRSMNPEQILALRSEADSVDSPELGPPPVSKFIDGDPVKIDSPSQSRPEPQPESSPERRIQAPETLPSPQSEKLSRSPSPEKRREGTAAPTQDTKPKKLVLHEGKATSAPPPPPVKAGSKRKLGVRDDAENSRPPHRSTNENLPPRSMTDKQSIREKAGGKTLKELASLRKEARDRAATATNTRKPLAAKSTNDDMTSPKKSAKPMVKDEVIVIKADIQAKSSQGRPKAKAKGSALGTIEVVVEPEPLAPTVTSVTCSLDTPLNEAILLSPSSPEPLSSNDGLRGGTPPPSDVSSTREPARPSRRNRAAISYAEPNLRDKMRRPTKELTDAVSGEGKYARRSSQVDLVAPESVKVKREVEAEDNWKSLPAAPKLSSDNASENMPESPLAGKKPSDASSGTIRLETISNPNNEDEKGFKKTDSGTIDSDPISSSSIDIYEFTPSSPQLAKVEMKRKPGRKPGRRMSAAVQSDDGPVIKERGSSRRRSMML